MEKGFPYKVEDKMSVRIWSKK
ncbi:hypothetical protein Gohar_003807, partial [Gossypium harknessii]|nr:hypothetical protein [Gossypium harknessii]